MYVYALIKSDAILGIFDDVKKIQAILDEYSDADEYTHVKYEIDDSLQKEVIYAMRYVDTNHIAYLTNNLELFQENQTRLLEIGLTYLEPFEYCAYKLNELIKYTHSTVDEIDINKLLIYSQEFSKSTHS